MTDEQRPILSSAPLVRYMRPDRPIRLKNSTCPYCHCALTSHHNRNLEHVIGRRFVPKGTMLGSWNLHLWACKSCNDQKAGLESDISAVTLHQLAFMPIDHGDAARYLWPEVKRKGRVHSPVSRRFVAESRTNTSVVGRMGSMHVKFDLIGPPQIDPDRVLRLAAMHVRGLAYLPFFDSATNDAAGVPGTIMLVAECWRGDWGNRRALAYQTSTSQWLTSIVVPETAQGFFRAAIRRRPSLPPVWSWALEWNRAYRTMGFLGNDPDELRTLADALPNIEWDHQWQTQDPVQGRIESHARTETQILESEDTLFSNPI